MTEFNRTVMTVLGMLLALSGSNSKESSAQAQQPVMGAVGAREFVTLDLGDKVTMKLVRIPAGKFLMGSPESEADREDSETQHEVTISTPFHMGVTHVTVDQFAAFAKESGYKTDAEKEGRSPSAPIKYGKLDMYSKHGIKRVEGVSWRKPGFEQKGDHPVVQASWNDATAFCRWLSKKSGRTIALPTEAQWEYACRAGSITAFPWGDDPDDGKGWANASDQSLKKLMPYAPPDWTFFSWDDGFVYTSPAGSLKANAFGLYDMIGNAMHWCQDGYGEYERRAVTDPVTVGDGDYYIARGAYWASNPFACRSAYRFASAPSYRADGFGFRVVAASADK